jgi:outer membrane protein assembly factor BamB
MDRDGPEERVVCLDAAKGDELWAYRYPADYHRVDYGSGPRATPTVHDGRVYTVGATGILLCLEAKPADGKPKALWQHDLVAEFDAGSQFPRWGIACSPLIEGDLVVAQPGGKDGSIAAFNRQTGELVWKALSDESGYSSPVAGTLAGVRQIICLTGRNLVGLHPGDGSQLWTYRWATQFNGNIATPIVAGNYVFVSSGYDKGCALVEVSGDAGGLRAAHVYVRPRRQLMQNHHSTCVLHQGHLYGYDEGQGAWKCIDLRTAQAQWTSEEVNKGCAIYADGHLIILTQNGLLALVEATPEAFWLKGQAQLFHGKDVWALPVVADGRLYVRDHKEVVCLDIKK